MNADDESAFNALITGAAFNFRFEVTPLVLETLWQGLQDLTLGQVANATGRAIRELQFMPTVAEMRRLAGKAAGPVYYASALPALKAIECCAFHRGEAQAPPRAPVAWCRVCRRIAKLEALGAKPGAVGELLRAIPGGRR